MSVLVLLLLAGPMLAATVSLALPSTLGRLRLARWTAMSMVVVSAVLVVSVGAGHKTVVSFGGWSAPFGIAFQVDHLAALFSLLLSLVLLATVLTLTSRPPGRSPEAADGIEETEDGSHGETIRRIVPAALFLASALAGAFLTSDLFNLFVMFELALISSYLLLQASGSGARRAAAPYVTMNVLASVFFLLGIGVLYTLGGTLSVPHLTAALAQVDSPWKTTGVGLLALAFATKAGMVPLMFWLPRTYPHLFGPVAALFAGMMTKLGVYALLRTAPLMAGTVIPEVLIWVGAVSALLAVLAAQAQTKFRPLLSFHVVSQVGFMLVGIGLASVAGITGTLIYVGHHVLVKTSLFLIADAVDGGDPDQASGSAAARELRSSPASAALVAGFLVSGLSLAGLPPLSGFIGKVAVFQPLIAAQRPVIVAILLLASFFTLVSILKIWYAGFHVPASPIGKRRNLPLGAGILVVTALIFVLAAGPIYDFAHSGAEALLAPPQLSFPLEIS